MGKRFGIVTSLLIFMFACQTSADPMHRFLPPTDRFNVYERFFEELQEHVRPIASDSICAVFPVECGRIDALLEFRNFAGIYLIFGEPSSQSYDIWVSSNSKASQSGWIEVGRKDTPIHFSVEYYQIARGHNCEPDKFERIIKFLDESDYTIMRQVITKHRCEVGIVELDLGNSQAMGESTVISDIQTQIFKTWIEND